MLPPLPSCPPTFPRSLPSCPPARLALPSPALPRFARLPAALKGWNAVPIVTCAGQASCAINATTLVGYPQPGDPSFLDYGERWRLSHGTAVAGILAARTNNSIGVAGLAYQAPLLVCRVWNESAEAGGHLGSIFRCVDLCLEEGAQVFSMSIGSPGREGPDEGMLAMARRIRDAGALIVAAAGNSAFNFNTPSTSLMWLYPAALSHSNWGFDNVVTVAATETQAGTVQLWSDSNFGPSVVHLAAPGAGILTTHWPLASDGTAQYRERV